MSAKRSMLKSNNNHCQPDAFGKQKGEISPFFHIDKKEKYIDILNIHGIDASLLSDSELLQFSIFFHEEDRSKMLSNAMAEAKKRSDTECEICGICDGLARTISESTSLFSYTPTEKNSLSAACAGIVIRFATQKQIINTKFISELNIYLSEEKSDDNFFYIRKMVTLCEIAMEECHALPSDWEQIRKQCLQIPPAETAKELSRILNAYRETDDFLSSILPKAAKAAKGNDLTAYNRFLSIAALRLHDTVALLKFRRNEELPCPN